MVGTYKTYLMYGNGMYREKYQWSTLYLPDKLVSMTYVNMADKIDL